MTLDCYDFDAGQVRHFPAGTHREQTGTWAGRQELSLMRLLWRCWVIFKHKKLSEWDADDQKFASWLAEKRPIDDTALNRVIKQIWQLRAA